ncbi:GNAT family N-acetyltransferase [Hymenobacter lapidiphilus]|uniref:GNAT family N-acetyltransferase n=1 Tax=Hymenobacter sp. CCM 8763 TaxID=2303334 RepID=UPI000E356CEC|nr:GNAT family N-acetyltransferase [Hymenobacter sp. CCM 8763]RFP65146.1 GNAT family N-acetyltransferase [Hymenobacter sp. CCM 8763]
MLRLLRTDSDNPDFLRLVGLLDADLAVRDGAEHAFYAQLNHAAMAHLRHAVVAYQQNEPVACGAFKEFAPDLVEIKRVFVQPAFRGLGAARAVLMELEQWAGELAYAGYVLETGQNQPEAIRLYESSGYRRTPNFGPYAGVANSVCMRKSAGESV